MKLNNLLLLLCFGLMAQTSWASGPSVNTEDNAEGLISVQDLVADKATFTKTLSKKELRKHKRELRKQARMEKRIAKFQEKLEKRMAKKPVDFRDPVDKWFWFWIFGWGAAIILSVIGAAIAVGGAFTGGFGVGAFLLILGWLAGLFGTISLIIWLVKKFG